PKGQATTDHFDYGVTSSYGSQSPVPDASAGSSSSDQSESATLAGLSASTYHYRIVATNSSGTTYGAGQTFSTPSAYRDAVQGTGGLIGYWRLGELSGTTAIDGTGARNGSYVNGPTLGQSGALVGDPNPAVAFGGSNQYVSVPYSAALNAGTFSVEAWAKATGGSGTWRTVLGARSYPTGYNIYASASNTWQLWLGNGGGGMQVLNGGSITPGWHRLVGTYDGTTARFYVDGAQTDSASLTFTPD